MPEMMSTAASCSLRQHAPHPIIVTRTKNVGCNDASSYVFSADSESVYVGLESSLKGGTFIAEWDPIAAWMPLATAP